MWYGNGRESFRDSEGPVLRNPLAASNSRGRSGRGYGRGRGASGGRGGNRNRPHPYQNNRNNSKGNMSNHNRDINNSNNNGPGGGFGIIGFNNNTDDDNNASNSPRDYMFPPTHEESSLFPAVPPFSQPHPQPSPPVSTLGSVLGLPPLMALMGLPPQQSTMPTLDQQQALTDMPPQFVGAANFFSDNNVNLLSQNQQNNWNQRPPSLLNPPYLAASTNEFNNRPPSLLNPPYLASARNETNNPPFHGNARFNAFENGPPPVESPVQNTHTLDLRPQWNFSSPQSGFGSGMDQPALQQSQRSFSSSSDKDFSKNSGSTGTGSLSFSQHVHRNSQKTGHSSQGPQNYQQIKQPPSSATPVPVYSTPASSSFRGRGRNTYQRGRGGKASQNTTGNPNLITPPVQKQPLLVTPKLIPYPPPPRNPQPAANASLLRNPLCTPTPMLYENFIKERNPTCKTSITSTSLTPTSTSRHIPSSQSGSVVPYMDDEDDHDDEVEYCGDFQLNEKSKSEDMTHDFFSRKMVQHFKFLFEGKSLEEQLDQLLDYLILASNFLTTRVSIVRNLHGLLTNTFKKCVLHPYGADFIGIGNSDDSVNVFVDLTGKQGSSENLASVDIEPSEITKENLDELLELIQDDKHHKFFGQIVRRTNFTHSRVSLPVISFIHSETKVRCNIRLENYLLVQEAKIIQFIRSLDPRIPPLLTLVRYWSSVHKVLDTPEEDTKNRFTTLLMLFFLARKKIIPTMAELQSLSVKREYFENLDIGFCDDYSLVPPTENPALEDKCVLTLSTLALLKEFFNLFASANFGKEVVSLWKAEFIPKDNFSPQLESKALPPDVRKRYRYGANGKLRDKRINCGSKLCIQDFQDLTENLTLAVAEYDLSKFQLECEIGAKELENIMAGESGLMEMFVITDYATYGTPEHKSMNEMAYLLESISEAWKKKDTNFSKATPDQ